MNNKLDQITGSLLLSPKIFHCRTKEKAAGTGGIKKPCFGRASLCQAKSSEKRSDFSSRAWTGCFLLESLDSVNRNTAVKKFFVS
jgi:hypothetical protein